MAWLHGCMAAWQREEKDPERGPFVVGWWIRTLVGECNVLLQINFIRVYRVLLVCTVGMYLGREGYQPSIVMYPSMFMHVQGIYHTGRPLWSLSKPDQHSGTTKPARPHSRSIAYVIKNI
jgi:hypothetical protein